MDHEIEIYGYWDTLQEMQAGNRNALLQRERARLHPVNSGPRFLRAQRLG
jgi:hypothetical protein